MSEAPATIELIAGQLAELRALLGRHGNVDPRFLSIADSARYCGLSVESVRRLVSSGRLTALRPVRGRIVLDRHELDSFVSGAVNTVRKGRGTNRRNHSRRSSPAAANSKDVGD